MGKAQNTPAPEQSKQVDEKNPQPFIATPDTMTCYDMTVGELVDAAKSDIARLQSEYRDAIAGKDSEIAAAASEVNRTTAALNEATAELERVKADLEEERQRTGMRKNRDGSLTLRIKVPEEQALAFVAQAEDAHEDPEVYIQRQVEESLLAYACSAG